MCLNSLCLCGEYLFPYSQFKFALGDGSWPMTAVFNAPLDFLPGRVRAYLFTPECSPMVLSGTGSLPSAPAVRATKAGS